MDTRRVANRSTRPRIRSALCALLAVSSAAAAHAQTQPSQQPAFPPPKREAQSGTQAQGRAQPAQGGSAQQSGPQVVEHSRAHEAQTRSQGRGIEYGGHLVVPVWLTEPADGLELKPGIGLQGRIGWEFPSGLTTELVLGGMFNNYRDYTDQSLTNVWVGAGARYAFLNPSAFVPFIGAGVQLNFWSTCFDDTATVKYCVDNAMTIGINGTVGAIYELSRFVAIELGGQINASFEGDAQFDGIQLYVSPFIGGTLYF